MSSLIAIVFHTSMTFGSNVGKTSEYLERLIEVKYEGN